MNRLTTALFLCAACMALSLAAFGQIRLYDSNGDDLAKKTRSTFDDFSKGDNNVFETMVANTLAMKEATLAQLYDLNRQKVHAKVNLIPETTWTALRQRVLDSQQEFVSAYADAQLILGLSTPSDAANALKQEEAKLAVLKNKKSSQEKAVQSEAAKLKDMQDSLQKVRDGVAGAAKPIHKLSDLDTEFKNLKTVWDGVEGAKTWLEAAEKSTQAPGLQLTILDLAVQRQQIKVERLQLELDHIAAQQEIADRIAGRLALVWGNGEPDARGEIRQGEFGKIYAYLEICTPGTACAHHFLTAADNLAEQVMQTIGRLSTTANAEVGRPLDSTLALRNLLDILGRYVSVIGYQRYLLGVDTIESVTDDQIFAIRQSALNAKERSVLISHGLEGLAAYYSGGIKPEEIANLMRAAQTAAQAVVAGKVN